MQISKYTSSKEIINNLYRNTGISESVNYSDMAYWIYEAMELINHPLTYIPKLTGHLAEESYDLENYKVELPSDFHQLIAVAIDGVLCVPSQNLFHMMQDGNCCDFGQNNYPADLFYDNFGNTFSPNALPQWRINSNKPPTYTISDYHITFDIKEGAVCMVYFAFPVDDEGFPLIPDDVKYKRACSAYLQYKYDYILWRQDLLSEAKFRYAEDEKDWAIASCQSHLKMPDLNQMESIRRQMTKMIVRNEDFKTAFNYINSRGVRGRY